MKIYIVKGNTGEYADYREWNVCAYRTPEAAAARVRELDALMTTLQATPSKDYMQRIEATDAMRKHERGDPGFSLEHAGTQYLFEEVELEGAA